MILNKSYALLRNQNEEGCINVKDSLPTSIDNYVMAVSKKDAIESYKSFYSLEEINLICQTTAINGDNYYPLMAAKLTKFAPHAGFLRLEFAETLSNVQIWDTLTFRDNDNNSYTFTSSSWYAPLANTCEFAMIGNNELYLKNGYTSASTAVIPLLVYF